MGARFDGDCFSRGGLRHHAGGCGRSGTGIVLLVGTRRSRRGTCLRGSIRSRRMGKEELLRHDLRCERRTAVSRRSFAASDSPARRSPDRATVFRAPARRAVPCAHAVGFAAKLACARPVPHAQPERQVRNLARFHSQHRQHSSPFPREKHGSFSSSFPLAFRFWG